MAREEVDTHGNVQSGLVMELTLMVRVTGPRCKLEIVLYLESGCMCDFYSVLPTAKLSPLFFSDDEVAICSAF